MDVNGWHMDDDVVVSLLVGPEGKEDADGDDDPRQDVGQRRRALLGFGFWIVFHFSLSEAKSCLELPSLKARIMPWNWRGERIEPPGKGRKMSFFDV